MDKLTQPQQKVLLILSHILKKHYDKSDSIPLHHPDAEIGVVRFRIGRLRKHVDESLEAGSYGGDTRRHTLNELRNYFYEGIKARWIDELK